MAVDSRHRIVAFNRALEEMTGFPADEMLGGSCCLLFGAYTSDGTSYCNGSCPLTALTDGAPRNRPTDVRISTRHGAGLWAEVTTAPARDAAGIVVGVIHTIREASPASEVERIKDEFLSLISHELRTPLTSILGYTQMAIRRSQGRHASEEELRWLGIVKQQADRLTQMVDRLLEVSRLGAGRIRLYRVPVSLTQLAANAVAAFRRIYPGYPISFEPPEAAPPVLVDPRRIEQVLANLLDNAARFSPLGTPVEVRLGFEDSLATVVVHDHGPGIEQETLRHIFERFFRAPGVFAPGVGLGLHISRLLVESHGGTIRAESEVGAGTTVTFTLPLAPGH